MDAPLKEKAGVVCFCVFVFVWLLVGFRGFLHDDSRWAWGMFPYVLAVEVVEVRFVDARGETRAWKNTKGTKPPRELRPGRKDERYGYGKGGYDDLVRRFLVVVAADARRKDVAVEAVVVTKRSDRDEVREVVRHELRQP